MDRQSVAEREGVEHSFGIEAQEPAQGTLLVRLGGSLGAAAVDSIDDCVDRRLIEPELRRLVVDLSRVVQLAPAALSLLVRLHRRCRVENRHLVLVGVSRPAVSRALRMSGLLPLFDIRPTVDAALRGPILLPLHP